MRPRLSLKGRALKFLSAREHSRSELRLKLMRHAGRDAPHGPATDAVAIDPDCPPDDLPDHGQLQAEAAARVDAVLDELEALRLLSNERFVESLSHRRAERYGSLRLAQELKAHRIDPELARAALSQARDTELERAHALWMRKFGEKAESPEARLRQQRFLASRGFAPAIIGKVLKMGPGDEPDLG